MSKRNQSWMLVRDFLTYPVVPDLLWAFSGTNNVHSLFVKWPSSYGKWQRPSEAMKKPCLWNDKDYSVLWNERIYSDKQTGPSLSTNVNPVWHLNDDTVLMVKVVFTNKIHHIKWSSGCNCTFVIYRFESPHGRFYVGRGSRWFWVWLVNRPVPSILLHCLM